MNWKTEDTTDLDYSPLPAARRNNNEEDFQFTQEVRLASAAAAPIALSSTASLKWQAGVFFFSQNYDQSAVNSLAPFVLSPQIPIRGRLRPRRSPSSRIAASASTARAP